MCPQVRSGRVRKIPAAPGFDPRTAQLVAESTHVLNKIRFMTNINLPHVSALGFFQIKGIQPSPSLEIIKLKFQKT